MHLVRHIYYIYSWTGGLTLVLGLGNCGWTNSASDNIIAISKGLYDRNGGSNCGQVKFHLPSYCYPRWSFLYRVCTLHALPVEGQHMLQLRIVVNLVETMILVRSHSILQINTLNHLLKLKTCPRLFSNNLIHFPSVYSRSLGISRVNNGNPKEALACPLYLESMTLVVITPPPEFLSNRLRLSRSIGSHGSMDIHLLRTTTLEAH